ncbi:MAG: hypothetical protein H7Y02_06440 [Candidatus Obscuribacterales bacterium]|nr:hypothetical protein [Steroidobacteraceae bacterium]
MFDFTYAIDNKRLVSFDYGGFERVVEPHTFGIDKDNRRVLVAYQVEGASRSDKLGWKSFIQHGMTNVVVLEREFSRPRPEYKRDDRAFKLIISQL